MTRGFSPHGFSSHAFQMDALLVQRGGPALPYPTKRIPVGRGRPLKDICEELQRELGEPVIAVTPDLSEFAGEYLGRQIDELQAALKTFVAERKTLDDYRDSAVEAHARALLRRLEEEGEMCAILLVLHH